MKVLFFDCFSGISGDMTLAALLDLGIDEELFRKELEKLNLDGYQLYIDRKSKNGIIGTDVTVALEDESGSEEHHDSHEHQHPHEHDHHHSHEGHHDHHGHSHDHSHGHSHPQQEHDHSHEARNLRDIEELIDSSGIKPGAKEFGKKVFREIAKAEAKVHNKDIMEVHFHEVGAVDSIVDIVGVSICLDLLSVERVFASPLHDGHGFIKCQHGTIPVPVPAVMEMLAGTDIPLVQTDIKTELITPTGMGIIKCLSSGFGSMPVMAVKKVAYGMGKRETGGFNALRVILGTMEEQTQVNDEIIVLETNIDNMNPEVLGYTMEKLLENGALDVFHTPVYMKKNRPAVMLSVLAHAGSEEKLVDILLRETTTLGIRRNVAKRYCMDRRFVTVNTPWGEVKMKVASLGEVEKASPEYEDCVEIARRAGVSLQRVMEEARRAFYA